jgi:beta-lactamase class A
MTRSQVNDPKAQNLRPLMAELTALVIPALLG